jgi:hypothetical protein
MTCFGDRAEPALQMLAARALLQEARLLEAEGDERAGAVFEAVADRWSGESDPLVRSVVLEARANRAVLDLASLQAGDHASLQMAKRVSDRAVALLPAV